MGFLRRPVAILAALLTALTIALLNDRCDIMQFLYVVFYTYGVDLLAILSRTCDYISCHVLPCVKNQSLKV